MSAGTLGDSIHKTGKVQDREAGQGSAPARPGWAVARVVAVTRWPESASPDHHQLLQSAQVRHRQQTLPQHCPRYLSGKTWCQANPRHDMVVMFSRVCILKLCILKKKDFSDVYIFKESQSIFEYALRYAWCYPLWWVRDCTVHNSCQPFKTLEKVVIHMRNLEWGE